ncbi:sodium pump decarboxylase subunit gamma [Microbulbifer flavimaris]|uniref:Probable oxaloacetate decarboxylase gamma chain n=1 Tax=Microbulbifer flavimaris TaxID=1781068 RepID=A0ABX4HWU8_9GAMM|nr:MULTISPECIES: OadG family protein [Microbulbifer]KUJ79160.1 sodium pump decarboxylase subunit gamma [Microbulbifer sp. ZGT114]PCO04083.1 sodium pump decarboxylase subunit gamma [Microbulbifer flavimaris]
MQETLLQQGLDITLFGMGIVFSFLLLLVIGTGIMSRIIVRNFPEAEPVPSTRPSGLGDEARLRAIAKAAIEQHRKRQK